MGKAVAEDMVTLPKEEYRMLKELYITVKRQNLILRIAEAEENLKKGKVRKVSTDKFIESM
jgi:hypothetical protein